MKTLVIAIFIAALLGFTYIIYIQNKVYYNSTKILNSDKEKIKPIKLPEMRIIVKDDGPFTELPRWRNADPTEATSMHHIKGLSYDNKKIIFDRELLDVQENNPKQWKRKQTSSKK